MVVTTKNGKPCRVQATGTRAMISKRQAQGVGQRARDAAMASDRVAEWDIEISAELLEQRREIVQHVLAAFSWFTESITEG